MPRLFHTLRDALATFAAASRAAAAVEVNRMPDHATLARLGIPATALARVTH